MRKQNSTTRCIVYRAVLAITFHFDIFHHPNPTDSLHAQRLGPLSRFSFRTHRHFPKFFPRCLNVNPFLVAIRVGGILPLNNPFISFPRVQIHHCCLHLTLLIQFCACRPKFQVDCSLHIPMCAVSFPREGVETAWICVDGKCTTNTTRIDRLARTETHGIHSPPLS